MHTDCIGGDCVIRGVYGVGRTPLMCALDKGQVPAVKSLMALGADIHNKSNLVSIYVYYIELPYQTAFILTCKRKREFVPVVCVPYRPVFG